MWVCRGTAYARVFELVQIKHKFDGGLDNRYSAANVAGSIPTQSWDPDRKARRGSWTSNIDMSQDQLIKLACTKCGRINYWSRKNRKLVERKIELKKFCKWCRAQTTHKEAKK